MRTKRQTTKQRPTNQPTTDDQPTTNDQSTQSPTEEKSSISIQGNLNNIISGDNNKQITNNYGISLKEYEDGLKRREKEVREEMRTANREQQKILQLENQVIATKLENVSKSHEEYIKELKTNIARLEKENKERTQS